MTISTFLNSNFATCIQRCDIKTAQWYGRFYIVGSIPGTCYDAQRRGSKSYTTESEALEAILADPWIQANPDQKIQLADCSVFNRSK